jgi:hypothetical protein
MEKTREQLLIELGFSEELISKLSQSDNFLDFKTKEKIDFNCIVSDNDDFSAVVIDKIEQPFVSLINYSEKY